MNTMNKTLAAEKRVAEQHIDVSVMMEFFSNYANDYIGVDKRTGLQTTLKQEVGQAAKLTHMAYVDDGVNYYRSYSARNIAELSVEERVAKSDALYKKAANKIAWLSRTSREYTGEFFLKDKIDFDNIDEVRAYVDSFEFVVAHVSMWNEI